MRYNRTFVRGDVSVCSQGNKMNKLLFSTVGLTALALNWTAMAADMPIKAPAATPASYSWTGFYIGGNVGEDWLNTANTTISGADSPTVLGFAACFAALSCQSTIPTSVGRHLEAGGQLGYNWQWDRNLIGIEADYQDARARAVSNSPAPNVPPFFAANQETYTQTLQSFGTVRARGGLLLWPNILAYATAGLAYGSVQRNYLFCGANQPGVCVAPTGQSSAGSSQTHQMGWTVGAGFEWAIGRASLGFEYLYMDLNNGATTSSAVFNVGGCNAANCNFSVRSGDLINQVARVKLNYRFWEN